MSAPQSEESIFSVDTLVKYMGGDDKARAIVAKIVRDACAPGMAPLETAGAALREQRLAEAGKILHGLRGSVGALGAKRLVAASLALEKAIAGAELAAIPALYLTLEAEYQLVLRDADAWLRTTPPPAA
jgi:hypothetical protein